MKDSSTGLNLIGNEKCNLSRTGNPVCVLRVRTASSGGRCLEVIHIASKLKIKECYIFSIKAQFSLFFRMNLKQGGTSFGQQHFIAKAMFVGNNKSCNQQSILNDMLKQETRKKKRTFSGDKYLQKNHRSPQNVLVKIKTMNVTAASGKKIQTGSSAALNPAVFFLSQVQFSHCEEFSLPQLVGTNSHHPPPFLGPLSETRVTNVTKVL